MRKHALLPFQILIVIGHFLPKCASEGRRSNISHAPAAVARARRAVEARGLASPLPCVSVVRGEPSGAAAPRALALLAVAAVFPAAAGVVASACATRNPPIPQYPSMISPHRVTAVLASAAPAEAEGASPAVAVPAPPPCRYRHSPCQANRTGHDRPCRTIRAVAAAKRGEVQELPEARRQRFFLPPPVALRPCCGRLPAPPDAGVAQQMLGSSPCARR